jgi:uncharacterized protein (DUF58 family)
MKRVQLGSNVTLLSLYGKNVTLLSRVVTPLGWLTLAGSLAAWLLGARLGWIELVLAGAAGLLTFLLCGLLTIGRTLLRVQLDLRPFRLVAGTTADGVVEVTNTSRTRLLPIALELPVGPSSLHFEVPGIAAGHSHTERFEVPTTRRGVIPVGPATTVRGDPFGLLRRAVSWTDTRELFVHPATVLLEPLGSGLLRDLEGRTTNDISMSDLAFHALREYAPGDDRRYIHWRSSAKLAATVPDGRFMVRQFLDTRRAHLTVIVDDDRDAYADPEHFELAVSAAASIAVRAIRDELDTTVFAGRHPMHDGTVPLALDAFARAELGGSALSTLAARAVRIAPATSIALLVTGSVPSLAELRRAAAQFSPGVGVAVVRVDPGASPGRSAAGALTVLSLRELADLPVLLSGGLS